MFAFCEVVLLLYISERLVLFTLAPVLGKPAEFVLRVKEYSHNVGRIEVGLEVVLIAVLSTNKQVGNQGKGTLCSIKQSRPEVSQSIKANLLKALTSLDF